MCLLVTFRDQMWPPGHHFNHLFSQSQVNKPLVRVFNVSFPEDIYYPEGDRRGPNLSLEYLIRILLGSPALGLSLSQFFELLLGLCNILFVLLLRFFIGLGIRGLISPQNLIQLVSSQQSLLSHSS